MIWRLLLTNWALVCGAMLVLWGISVVRRDASLVDRFWGLLFVLLAWSTQFMVSGSDRSWLLLGLSTVWGLRLSLYLSWRNWGEGEDSRYVQWRREQGPTFWWVSLFKVFLLQGTLAVVVGLPLQLGQLHPELPLGWLDYLGCAVFVVGLLFETVGDWQLTRFKADPANANKVMDRGLWKYTRHPNYFGDAVVWWGLYLVAAGNPTGLWTFAGPLLMTLLLLKVSGVSLLESTIVERRPAYRDYIARTSAFVPWPPRPAPPAGSERATGKTEEEACA